MSFKKTKEPLFVVKQKSSVTDPERIGNFKLSFQYLDTTQKFGSTFRDWQKGGLLSKAMETLQGYCCSTLKSGIDGDKFTIYGNYPPADKTDFKYPPNVPEDAHWARIHVNGKSVIIGHVVNDTFYIVFLDKSHHFYLTKRRTGK
ncbi:MAG: hypothetical protein HG422_08025 [Prevotella sp.]|nr:hypothetical protein [Prevotella sp.]